MEGHCDHVTKIVTGWCIWWLYCLQCYGISRQYQDQYKHFSDHWTLNNSQGGKKLDCNLPINVFLFGGSSSVIASVYSVSLAHVPRPTAGCLSIPRLGQLHHIFRFIMSNHFENLSLSSYILHKLICLSFESLSVFCFKMSSNVVNFPSEYLVCLQPDIWKTLLQGTSQIKINLSGCSMITKSFQKFGESSLKTVLWPPAIKLEFQPMCSLRLETYLYL